MRVWWSTNKTWLSYNDRFWMTYLTFSSAFIALHNCAFQQVRSSVRVSLLILTKHNRCLKTTLFDELYQVITGTSGWGRMIPWMAIHRKARQWSIAALPDINLVIKIVRLIIVQRSWFNGRVAHSTAIICSIKRHPLASKYTLLIILEYDIIHIYWALHMDALWIKMLLNYYPDWWL